MPQGQPDISNTTILVVDDDESVAGLLQAILSRDGHSVHTAGDGDEAVRLASELKPSLIFMDIAMPGMNGYEATANIKQLPGMKDTPVIFLSGKSAEEDGGRAFAQGGLTYLRKPFSNQQIRDLVNLTLQSMFGNA